MDNKTTTHQEDRAPLFSFAHEVAPDTQDAALREAFNQASPRPGPAATSGQGRVHLEEPLLKPTPAPDLDRNDDPKGASVKGRDQELQNTRQLGLGL